MGELGPNPFPEDWEEHDKEEIGEEEPRPEPRVEIVEPEDPDEVRRRHNLHPGRVMGGVKRGGGKGRKGYT